VQRVPWHQAIAYGPRQAPAFARDRPDSLIVIAQHGHRANCHGQRVGVSFLKISARPSDLPKVGDCRETNTKDGASKKILPFGGPPSRRDMRPAGARLGSQVNAATKIRTVLLFVAA
jgi:hypothetical protein